MANRNPFDFLSKWCEEHVNPTAYDDEAGAKLLASQCLGDAKAAGFSQDAITKAAGGNLASYMLTELESAASKELDRLASKRD